ncbi:hypothetical protein FLONG3_1868 [Fusarium longipes]|uniref:Uncharacterized protein n=1 Tax=Fusarium longipes TaxID=694270 RepID=A0A395T6G3_9HYPO|nr:hypothetical protein FLONG3_1868 [Fusarium longipes]
MKPAKTSSVNLVSSAADLSTQTLSHTQSRLPRRYKQGGATFTANRHGVFERAVKKHIIVRRPTDISQPGKFYIIRCDQHDTSFDDNPLQSALKHLRAKHGLTDAHHDTVIEHLGVEVIGCGDQDLEQNNAIAIKAFNDGTNALGKDSIRARDDSISSQPLTSDDDETKRPTARRMHSRKPKRSYRPRHQPSHQDTPLELIPGNVYVIWWFETKQWFAGLLIPPQNLESVGIYDSFEDMEIFKTIPSCYQYDSSSKSLSWANGYEEGGPRSSERYYPFIFFEGFQFPDSCHKAWVKLDEIQNWEEEKASIIEHSDQVIEFLRGQKEKEEQEIKRLGNDDEISDFIDGGESSQRSGHRNFDSNHHQDSDNDEIEHYSPLEESSENKQPTPEPSIATPDTINEQDAVMRREELANTVTFDHGHENWPHDRLEESELAAADVHHNDSDHHYAPGSMKPPATVVLLPGITVQQEEVPKDPDIDPDQATQVHDSTIQDFDEMDVITNENISEPGKLESNDLFEDVLEERPVATPSEESLHNASDNVEHDILMTTPCEEVSADEKSSQGDREVLTEAPESPIEDTPPVDTPRTDPEHLSDAEDGDTSQQSELTPQSNTDLPTESFSRQSSKESSLPRYNPNGKPQSTHETGQDRWTNEDIRRIISGASPEIDKAKDDFLATNRPPQPVLTQTPVVVQRTDLVQASEQDVDMDTLLEEAESLELHMSHSEPTSQQKTTDDQLSPTSDDDRLAHDTFNALISEDNQTSASENLPYTIPSHKDIYPLRPSLAGMRTERSVSSVPTSEGRSQLSPYDSMGEPASIYSRPVSKGSDMQPASYAETGTPASAFSQLSMTGHPAPDPSYDRIDRNVPVPTDIFTRNGHASHPVPTDTRMDHRVSTSVHPNSEHDPEMSLSGSVEQKTATDSPPSTRGSQLGPEVAGTVIQEMPAESNHEPRPLLQSPSVQIPLHGADTDQSSQINRSNGAQHTTSSLSASQVQTSHPACMRPESQVAVSPQLPTAAPSQSLGEPQSPRVHPTAMPPIVGMKSPQSIMPSVRQQESTVTPYYGTSTGDPQPRPSALPFSGPSLPPSPHPSASAPDALGLWRQTDVLTGESDNDTRSPNPRTYSGPDFSPIQLGSEGASMAFNSMAIGNNNASEAQIRSPGQHGLQSPRVSFTSQGTPLSQAMPSPKLANTNISRSSSLSQGYTVPPPQPLPSPRQFMGEAPGSATTTQQFHVADSQQQSTPEYTRPQTATYGQYRSHTAASPLYTATSLPPPSTLAQGPASLQVSASPRLQAMEISRPSSAARGGRPPTSPRQYAMRISRPNSIVPAPVKVLASPRVAAMNLSQQGSIVHGQHPPVGSSPQLSTGDTPRPSPVYGQSALSMMPSPRQNSFYESQPVSPAHGRAHQPPVGPSPHLGAAQLSRPHSSGHGWSGPQAMPTPRHSFTTTSRNGSVVSLPAAVTSPHLSGVRRDQYKRTLSDPGLADATATLQTVLYLPSNVKVVIMFLLHQYIRTITHPFKDLSIQWVILEDIHKQLASHTLTETVPKPRMQQPSSALRPASLASYVPPNVAEALIERSGRPGDDLQPGDFLNYQNIGNVLVRSPWVR